MVEPLESPTSVLDDSTVEDLLDALVKNKAQIHFTGEFDDGAEAERTMERMLSDCNLDDDESESAAVSETKVSTEANVRGAGTASTSAIATSKTNTKVSKWPRTLVPLEVCALSEYKVFRGINRDFS
eukprot:8805298-Pyramimonas_sp.AAC.1